MAIAKGITVSFGNTPQAKNDLFAGTGLTEDSGIQYLDVMANDLGGNARALYSLDDGISAGGVRPADLLIQDAIGSVDYSALGARIWITAGGKVAYDAGPIANSLQHLRAGEYATDSFTYAISLGNGTLSWATATVQIFGVNDAPVANPDTLTASEDEPVTYAAAALLGNDTDIDGDTPTIVSVAGGTGVAAVLNGDGSVTITPIANFNGTADFTYKVTDGNLTSNAATVTVNVAAVDDAAVISGDSSGSVIEDEALMASGDLDSTDVDYPGDAWQAMTTPTASAAGYGTYTVNAAGVWNYALHNTLPAVQALGNGETLSDSFTVHTVDGTAQTVGITINGINDAPGIISAVAAGSVTELSDGSPGENTASLTSSETIAFGDVDLSDGHGVTVTPAASGYRGSLAASITNVSTGDGAGVVTWSYSVDDADLDDLGPGQSLAQIYTIAIDDGHGGLVAQDVVITLNGSDDGPVNIELVEPEVGASGVSGATGANGTWSAVHGGPGANGSDGADAAASHGPAALNGGAGIDSLSVDVSARGGNGGAGGTGGEGNDSGWFTYTSPNGTNGTNYTFIASTPGYGGSGGDGGNGGDGRAEITAGSLNGAAGSDHLQLTASAVGGNGGAGGHGGAGGSGLAAPSPSFYSQTYFVQTGRDFFGNPFGYWVTNNYSYYGTFSSPRGDGGNGGSGGSALASVTGSTLTGGGGADILDISVSAFGGSGAFGGGADPFYTYGGVGGAGGAASATIGNNTVDGGAGNDVLQLGASAAPGVGGYGGYGHGFTSWGGPRGSAVVSIHDNTLTGGAGNDQLTISGTLTLGALSLAGGSAGPASVSIVDNRLEGGEGNDVLALALSITGSYYGVDVHGNTLSGGDGLDTADFNAVDRAVHVDLEAGAFSLAGGGANAIDSIEGVIGTAVNDTLVGSSGDDTLQGGRGDDSLNGGDGMDVMSLADGTAGIDFSLAQGAATVDLTSIGLGYDTYEGIEGVNGTDFGDRLVLNGANNVVSGGAGNDLLIGNGGDDTFQFDLHASTAGVNDGADRILDWGAGDQLTFTDVPHVAGNTHLQDVEAAISSITSSGGSATINFRNGATLTFDGVAAAGATVHDQFMSLVDKTENPANHVPVANADSYIVTQNMTFSSGAAGVLGNDTDADGDRLTAFVTVQPSHGTLVFASDGGFDYTPVNGFLGNDSFTYRTFDRSAYSEAVVGLEVVAPVNIAVVESEVGASGAYGAAGTNGTWGAEHGGAGGNGSDGADAAASHGPAALNGAAGVDSLSVDVSARGGNGGAGGTGGEGDDSAWITYTAPNGTNGTNYTYVASNAGYGGSGGDGGNGGDGRAEITADSLDGAAGSDHLQLTASAVGGNGGAGGHGGAGGNGLVAPSPAFYSQTYFVQTGLDFFHRPIGYWVTNSYSYYGTSFAPRGDGGNGGSGGSALASVTDSSLNGGGGDDVLDISTSAAGGSGGSGGGADPFYTYGGVGGAGGASSATIGHNTIDGGAGNDVLELNASAVAGGGGHGGYGHGFLSWGGPGDNAVVAIVDNTLTGGAGDDRLSISGALTLGPLSVASGSASLASVSIVGNRLEGGEGDDVLAITLSANSYYGIDVHGNTLSGGDGIDTADFSAVDRAVQVDLHAGTFNLTGGGANAIDSTESVIGTAFNDTLVGSSSDDALRGGEGDDTLSGGAGADRFEFDSIGDGTDTITDFTPGAGGDVLDIKDVLSGYTPGVSEVSDFVQLVEAGGDTGVGVNADGVGTDFVALATLQGVTGALIDDLLAQGNLVV